MFPKSWLKFGLGILWNSAISMSSANLKCFGNLANFFTASPWSTMPGASFQSTRIFFSSRVSLFHLRPTAFSSQSDLSFSRSFASKPEKEEKKIGKNQQKTDSFSNRYFLLSAQNWDEASPTFSFYLILQNRRILRECWVDSLLNISISLDQSPFVTNFPLAFPILAA